MKRQWLSLKRRSNEVQGTCNDPIEISDDESFDLSPNVKKSSKESIDVTSHGAANVPNDDDASDNVFNQSQSMFKWNKPIFAPAVPSSSYSFPENSGLRKVMPIEASNKRQKIMNGSTSYDDLSSSDDELTNLGIFKKDDLPPQVEIQHKVIEIAGVKVKFPVEPYPCQKSVMNSLINGCNKEQNCLLESPTGSGKTLALLCGALAWQEKYSEKIHREESVLDATDTAGSSCHKDDSLHENFFLNSSQYLDKELCNEVSCTDKAWKVPKIYYGTRTHKQIKQVVRELKKTAYRHKRMTILSSRQHTCIQNINRDKNELCNELLDPLKGKGCRYYNEHNKIKAVVNDVKEPWDIEDLVSLGRNIRACPYFGARSLMENAEIIFCPYNYILDPDIRESMQINLKGDIVILDEAHNVEDLCREAASVKLRDDEFTIAIKECEHLLDKGRNRVTYSTIREYLTDIVKFLKNVEVEESPSASDDSRISKTWFGIEFRVLLDVHNVGCSRFPIFLAASKSAIEDFVENTREENREKMIPTISRDTKRTLEYLCFAMQMITSDIFVNDYRMYVTETIGPTKKFATENVWLPAKTVVSSEIRTMKMICMNPSIIFAPLARIVRSVIVASGTLTPTASFQSELGTQFPNIVNPGHIIPKDQVYVRCIPRGPSGISLRATYDAVNSWQFQDELGKLILQVCDSVPYGVLCFFSSYKTMNTIHDRWKSNGMWKKLSGLKKIFVEPKDNRELPEVMAEYCRVIEESSSKSFRIACGAILFAIYRGKVAEGIDFSDNEARCVLAVGIPYLLKNNDVDMKMRYNDLNRSKGLLSGSEWYTINAFRALNQALGRCVRHKGDWGAVLLVDERHQQSSNLFTRVYTNYLSKWIKTNMKPEGQNNDLEIALQDFVALQIAREKGEKCADVTAEN